MEKGCQNCGKKLEKGQKTYCSRACRNKANPRQYREIPSIPTTCVVCGAEFLATRKDRLYCSAICNKRAQQERRPKRSMPGQTYWRKKRDVVFREQNGVCWLCSEPMDKNRFDVHHLRDDHDLFSEDIVALHRECHVQMHRVTVRVVGDSLEFHGKAVDLLKEKGYGRNEF